MTEGKFEGEAFIVTSKGWACSNDVTLDFRKTSVRDMNGKLQSIKKSQVMNINGLFGTLEKGERVEVAFSPEGENIVLGFVGNVHAVTNKTAILNILAKKDKVKEILSNITSKN